MKRSGKLILVGSTLAAIGAAVFVLRPGAGGAATPGKPALTAALVAPAVVEAVSDRIDLSFEVAGRVAEMVVAEGEQVKKGQVIARLDDTLAKARVARSEAALAAAEARRDLAKRGPRPAEIRAAQAEAEAAEAQSWERGRWHERAATLLENKAIGAAELDGAKGAADVARAQVAAAQARLALLKQGTREELVREAEAAVAAARAELEETRELLAHTALVSPIDGIVLRRLAEPGEHVSTMPPTVVMTVADTSKLRLRAEVDEADVGRVTVGQVGYATAVAFGDKRFPGHVVRVAGELGRKQVLSDDPRARIDTRVLEVEVELDWKDPLPLGLRMDIVLAD
jgi:HlyD family secretion protein